MEETMPGHLLKSCHTPVFVRGEASWPIAEDGELYFNCIACDAMLTAMAA
jgi:hypothetical protein